MSSLKLKQIAFTFVILSAIIFTSCKKSKTSAGTVESISFVYENGNVVASSDCINPNTVYAIAIKVKGASSGNFKSTIVKYSFNGVLNEMTFSSPGTNTKKVTLVNGVNTAKITETKQEAQITLKLQSDFELVN